MTENKPDTLREKFNEKLNLSYTESDGSFLWEWIQENFYHKSEAVPQEEIMEKMIEYKKDLDLKENITIRNFKAGKIDALQALLS